MFGGKGSGFTLQSFFVRQGANKKRIFAAIPHAYTQWGFTEFFPFYIQ